MYKKINFAGVVAIDDFNDPKTLAKRKAYIEQQLGNGFLAELSNYQKNNVHQYWRSLIAQSQQLIDQVREVYMKHPHNGQIMFQLEQVLGRAEYLFKNRGQAVKKSEPCAFQENLQQLALLSSQLAGHQSKRMNYLGISLMALGAFMAVLAVLASILTMGTTLVAGAAVIGLIFIGSGALALYKQQQKGLSLTASTLVTTANQVQATVDYFDNVVAPRLYAEDAAELRRKLVVQLHLGWDPVVLINALEWANYANYHNNGSWYENLYRSLTDVCCETPSYWISSIRQAKKCWPDSQPFHEQPERPAQTKNKMFAFFAKDPDPAASTLKLFNEISKGILSSEEQMILRDGIQHFINNGMPPVLLEKGIRWAKARYDDAEFPDTHIPFPDNHIDREDKFFKRLAFVCGIELAYEAPTPAF